MRDFEAIVPVYQTLSFWDLVDPGSNYWQSYFPFSAASGAWTFSGRVALHVGLRTLGLPAGSTILVPNYFQGVEIDTLLHNGFKLRFYRIGKGLEIDLDSAADGFDETVSAFYVIHYFGWPQRMNPIVAFCRERGLKLIEDCALALFSRDGDEWLGSRGEIAIYSQYKTLPLPHGGFLVAPRSGGHNDLVAPPLSSTVRQLTDLIQQDMRASGWAGPERWLRSVVTITRRMGPSPKAVGVTSGGATWDPRLLAYRASALTRALMKTAYPDRVISSRRRNYLYLRDRLEGRIESPLPELPEGVCPLFFPVMVKDKPAVIEQLAARGVGSVNLWWEPHPACPEKMAREVQHLRLGLLELPIHQSLSLEDVDLVADAFLDVIN